MKRHHFIGFILLLASISINSQDAIDPVITSNYPLVLISYPIDIGREKDRKKNLWLYSFFDVAARFRLDYCTSFKTVPFATMIKYASPVNNGSEINYPDFTPAIRDLQVTHQLQQKFEVDQKKKQIGIIIELTSLLHNRAQLSIETRCDFEDLGNKLDSCYIACIKSLANGNISPEEVRFFLKPAFCSTFQNNKRIGEIGRASCRERV